MWYWGITKLRKELLSTLVYWMGTSRHLAITPFLFETTFEALLQWFQVHKAVFEL